MAAVQPRKLTNDAEARLIVIVLRAILVAATVAIPALDDFLPTAIISPAFCAF